VVVSSSITLSARTNAGTGIESFVFGLMSYFFRVVIFDVFTSSSVLLFSLAKLYITLINATFSFCSCNKVYLWFICNAWISVSFYDKYFISSCFDLL
jgi:hypothetical protein